MTEDDLFTAILLAIGPWAFEREQADYIVAAYRQHLGKEADTLENFHFLSRYIKFCKGYKP